MTTGFEVHDDVLLEAARRCRRTVEEVRAAAAATGALEPSLGHGRVDALAREVLRDLADLLEGLAGGVQADADGLQDAVRAYATAEQRVLGRHGPG